MTATRFHRSHTEGTLPGSALPPPGGYPVSTNDARRSRTCCSAKNSSKETGCSTRAWRKIQRPDATGASINPMNAVSMCFVQKETARARNGRGRGIPAERFRALRMVRTLAGPGLAFARGHRGAPDAVQHARSVQRPLESPVSSRPAPRPRPSDLSRFRGRTGPPPFSLHVKTPREGRGPRARQPRNSGHEQGGRTNTEGRTIDRGGACTSAGVAEGSHSHDRARTREGQRPHNLPSRLRMIVSMSMMSARSGPRPFPADARLTAGARCDHASRQRPFRTSRDTRRPRASSGTGTGTGRRLPS